ncbi:MAG: hypothetical protein V4675_04415 [Verrucomicrobiota bacterium]
MKPEEDPSSAPIPPTPSKIIPETPHLRNDMRAEIRTTSHRVMGSRESQRPVERTNQSRKHGRHAGPRESEAGK